MAAAPMNRESKHPADHIPEVWDAKFQPMMDQILSSAGPKLGNAAEVGRRTVRYIRPKDILVWLWKNWDQVQTKYDGDATEELLKLNKEGSCDKLDEFPEDFDPEQLRPNDFVPLVELLIRKKFLYRADRHEVKIGQRDKADNSDEEEEAEAKQKELDRLLEKDKRWPKKLLPYPIHSPESSKFDLNSFYVVAYSRDTDKHWTNTLLGLLIVGAFIVVGYPAWPLWAKEIIAYFSVFLLSLLIFVSILRLITFVLLWYCGYDFWIMPNLWADDLGFFDTFRPLYTIGVRQDGTAMYIARAVAFVLMLLSFVKLSETHSLSDIGEFATIQYLEFVDWGVNTMTGQGAQLAAANTNQFGSFDLNELLKEEDDDDDEMEVIDDDEDDDDHDDIVVEDDQAEDDEDDDDDDDDDDYQLDEDRIAQVEGNKDEL